MQTLQGVEVLQSTTCTESEEDGSRGHYAWKRLQVSHAGCRMLRCCLFCGFKFYPSRHQRPCCIVFWYFSRYFFLVRSLCQCSSVVANKVFWMAFPRNRQPAFSGGRITTEPCFGDWYFGDVVRFTSFHIYVRSSLTMWVGQHSFKVGHEHHLQSTIPSMYGIRCICLLLPLKKHQA